MRYFVFLSLLVNCFLFYSIFDVYFKSPVVRVEKDHRPEEASSFERIVFIVGDGLRADLFFNHPENIPFFREVMTRNNAAWGISDSRVPTESRPGHIALFAGFFEDPSAVFTGWQENIVEFDSVFNRSKRAVAFGSPDVVPMFAKGMGKDKITYDSYAAEEQDFTRKNNSLLDSWVLEKFEAMAKNKLIPMESETLIFLHLLGIDNTGHANKPGSREYSQAINYVDTISRKIEQITNNYYNDDKTLFIFTSDHGMTNWGSHGGGSKDETECPYVVWGDGIKRMENHRLKQTDFAALISGGLGISFPTNSIGRFPVEIFQDERYAHLALHANFLQLVELYETKKALVVTERNFGIFEYEEDEGIEREISNSVVLKDMGKHDFGLDRLELGIDRVLNGIEYYERYDQTLLIFFTVTAFILWMLIITYFISSDALDDDLRGIRVGKNSLISTTLFSLIILKGVIGWSVWKGPYIWVVWFLSRLLVSLLSTKWLFEWKVAFLVPVSFALLNAFEERWTVSVGLVGIGIWILYRKWGIKGLVAVAPIGCLAVFPLAPAIGQERNLFLMSVGPLISAGFGFFFFFRIQETGIVLPIQSSLLFLSALLVQFPMSMLSRLMSWTSLVLVFLPTCTNEKYQVQRLISIFLALSIPFSYLSITHEALFLPTLFLGLLSFLWVEMRDETTFTEFLDLTTNYREKIGKRSMMSSLITASFHVFFVFASFFGMGNIGSISSFDPSAVVCFVSIFSPFMMTFLLVLKLLFPILLVSSFFRSIFSRREDVSRHFLILLFLSQGMALVAFFRLRNVGSWIEIGTALSVYVIVQALAVALILFHFLANFLNSFALFSFQPSDTLPKVHHKFQE